MILMYAVALGSGREEPCTRDLRGVSAPESILWPL